MAGVLAAVTGQNWITQDLISGKTYLEWSLVLGKHQHTVGLGGGILSTDVGNGMESEVI